MSKPSKELEENLFYKAGEEFVEEATRSRDQLMKTLALVTQAFDAYTGDSELINAFWAEKERVRRKIPKALDPSRNELVSCFDLMQFRTDHDMQYCFSLLGAPGKRTSWMTPRAVITKYQKGVHLNRVVIEDSTRIGAFGVRSFEPDYATEPDSCWVRSMCNHMWDRNSTRAFLVAYFEYLVLQRNR